MGELNFSDFYHQIKFKTDSALNKQKLGNICIKTAQGTLAYTQAPIGLLGMDVYQDELTNHLFSNLVLVGKLCKISDNIYFRGDTVPELASIFKDIVRRVHISNLQIKPTKVKICIKSAKILGFFW